MKEKFVYKTGCYYAISRDGVPSLLGKVIRRRGEKAEMLVINGGWRATFDAIGMHCTTLGTVYVVEAPILLSAELLNSLETRWGTEVLPYVEEALRTYHKSRDEEPKPRIFYGKSLADIKSVVPANYVIFEDRFKDCTFMEYEACWEILNKIDDTCTVICKTTDALKTAPSGSVFVRVGRSIRKSDRGAVIQTPITKEHFLSLEY